MLWCTCCADIVTQSQAREKGTCGVWSAPQAKNCWSKLGKKQLGWSPTCFLSSSISLTFVPFPMFVAFGFLRSARAKHLPPSCSIYSLDVAVGKWHLSVGFVPWKTYGSRDASLSLSLSPSMYIYIYSMRETVSGFETVAIHGIVGSIPRVGIPTVVWKTQYNHTPTIWTWYLPPLYGNIGMLYSWVYHINTFTYRTPAWSAGFTSLCIGDLPFSRIIWWTNIDWYQI